MKILKKELKMKKVNYLKLSFNFKNNGFILSLIFLITFIFYFTNSAYTIHPCNCEKDRILHLQEPLVEGKDVKILQEILKEFGYYYGNIDGVYGPLTARSVERFQNDYSLKTNGVVNRETWDVLGELTDTVLTSSKKKKPTGKLSIKIYLNRRTLVLLRNGLPYKKYPVTIGKKESPSPIGEWRIKNKYKRTDGGPLGSRWMGLNCPWGVYGIHGTNKPWQIGVAASKGCIRLHNLHAEELFDWVAIGTSVEIIGKRPGVSINYIIKPGEIGYDVMELQEKLRNRGFYQGDLNGNYNGITEAAVREFEAQFGLKNDGITDFNIINILGLKSK